jgi:hypothetical protein
VKALSLWQPWASLIAVGGKRIETRHWPAPSWLVGLYEPGRFAWVLQDVRRLVEPVAFRGRQGLFDVPDEIAGLATVPAAVEQTAS